MDNEPVERLISLAYLVIFGVVAFFVIKFAAIGAALVFLLLKDQYPLIGVGLSGAMLYAAFWLLRFVWVNTR